jgi:hypothetical protein
MTAAEYRATPKKPSKYRAKPQVVNGVRFASKAEFRRYCQLKQLELAGEISDLKLQPRFPLTINGVKVCTYVGDFLYMHAGKMVLEDVKGHSTAVYRLKKALLKAVLGHEITEVRF